jgi:prolyl oligopeptidase
MKTHVQRRQESGDRAEGEMSMKRGIAIAGVAVCALVACNASAQVPPDKFLWLAPIRGEKAIAWSQQQTAVTKAKLTSSPTFKTVMADIESVHAQGTELPSYYRVGQRYLRLTRNDAHPYGLLEYADAQPDGSPGAWRTGFDLDAYNKTVSQPYSIKWLNPVDECRPPLFDRCMLPLWPNGEQHNEYRELDLATGKFVDNGFKVGPSRSGVAWLDPDTLVVAHSTEGAPALPSQFPAELHLWKRGTPLAQAPTIFRAAPGDALFEHHVITAGGKRHIIVSLAQTYTSFQLKEITPAGHVTDLPLPTALNNFGTPAIANGQIVVQLAEPETVAGNRYPADTLIAYDLVSRKVTLVATPPKDAFLSGTVVGTKSQLLFVATRHLQQILYAAVPQRNGWKVEQRFVQHPGMTLQLRGTGETSNAALVLEQGLIVPPRVSIAQGSSAPVLIDSQKPFMDLSGYTVDVRSAQSNDGVSVDYYLMQKRGSATGPTPTILEGYGGFGVSNDPAYFGYHLGAGWKTWYDRGGAFAAAAVRGGGERGGAWHLAGAGAHKKQMFDDFNAVAEDLERTGVTDAAHLGIMGHSNGGMLVSGAETLRPDRYGAVLDGAPVTDIFSIGHGDGSIGAGMKTEMGDGDDPTQVATILKWSPYQNIKDGVRYPPTLAYVATTDTQVGPSHSRKFIARLQDVGAPAMLLEGAEGGHDYPSEFTQIPDTAMLTTFLVDALMKP